MRVVLRTFLHTAVHVTSTLAAIALVTVACRFAPVNATTAGFGYVIAVLVLATAWGIREAVLASLVAMLCFNFFFLPPIGTFTISDPQNWVALFAFLVTAIVASQLSAAARRQAGAALHRQRELEQLYALGRSILLDHGEGPLASRLARHVAESFQLTSVALFDAAAGKEYRAGSDDLVIPLPILSAALSGDIATRTDDLDARFALIRLGVKPAGVLGIRGRVSDTTMDAIANLVAIGLERARTQEAENRAEAARQSEEMKSMLLDAIAHEFKTPLTSIKAAATSVLAAPAVAGAHRELLLIVDEETDRLNHLVTDAIEISRIEGGHFKLKRTAVRIPDLVHRVAKQMKPRLAERDIEFELKLPLPGVLLDRDLIELAVRQLIDNAAKYSPAATPIRLGAEIRGKSVVLWVADKGPSVPAGEREHLFERFYRAKGNRHGVPGSGLGLFVVKQIAIAHGGDAVLDESSANGARFEIRLPLKETGEDDYQ